MTIIRSYKDAYDTANEIEHKLENGATEVSMNWINIRLVDGKFQVSGHAHGETTYGTKSELADFVLYPERKRWNDAVKAA